MNYIFYFLVVISIIAGAINGKLTDVVNSILTGAELSVKVAFSLIGIMAFWLGMMKIAEKCGLINIIAKIIKPITKRLFNEIPENSPAIGDIAMSFSANAFGLIAIFIGIGYKNPTEIIAPTLLVTSIAFISAILLAKIFQRFWAEQPATNADDTLQKEEGTQCSNQ